MSPGTPCASYISWSCLSLIRYRFLWMVWRAMSTTAASRFCRKSSSLSSRPPRSWRRSDFAAQAVQDLELLVGGHAVEVVIFCLAAVVRDGRLAPPLPRNRIGTTIRR